MPKQYSSNLVGKILLPIAIALLFLLAIGWYFYTQQQQVNLRQYIDKQATLFSNELHHEIQYKKRILESTHFLLSKNSAIQKAFEEKNQSSLIEHSQPLFESLNKKLNISHFYFTDLQRINLLRVHAHDRYGDKIDRKTTLASEEQNRIVTGLELGVLGTLTLRSVAPWANSEGKKIGYVELGIDINHLLEDISQRTGLGLFLAIEKRRLQKEQWTEGENLFGGEVEWNKFDHFVISHHFWLNSTQLNNLPDIDSHITENELLKTESTDGKTFYWKSIPVQSFGNVQTGNIYISIDMTDWLNASEQIAYRSIGIYIFISLLLLYVVSRFTRRVMVAESELNLSVNKLEKLATYDQLTKLPNRKLFLDEVEQRLNESKRFNEPFSVCFIDLDDFKVINDTMGHELGDQLLIQLGEHLQENVREYDVIARFGGDEFVLMMPQATSDNAAVVVSKILSMAKKPFYINNKEIYISLSIGISMFPQDGDNLDTLLRHADTAMYKAKDEGKNCFRFFTSGMNECLQRQLLVESRLRNAISNNELQLYYQPQINMASNKVCGYEALLRWFPADGELISPAEFIPVAENTSLIQDIGEWVLHEACRQRKAWKNTDNDFHIDINVSGSQLRYTGINKFISDALNQFELGFDDIGIELTENSLINADDALITDMKNLVNKGCSIAIDDFGTGYSSLSYLKKFPISIVKIDQSFVRDAHEDPDDRAIMKAIASMGHELGLKVIVEGIETIEQEQIAKDINCDIAQGYLYSKPKSAAEILIAKQ